MNKGLERSLGQYILFLNAGDTLPEPYILQKIQTAANNNPDFIYGDALEDSAYKPARAANDIAGGMFTHHQTAAKHPNTSQYATLHFWW